EQGVRPAKGDRLVDGRMTQEHLLHLIRRNLLTTTVDELLQTAREHQRTTIFQISLVARTKPAATESGDIGVGGLQVARDDLRATQDYFTDLTRGEQSASGIHDPDVRAAGRPDRRARATRPAHARNLVRGFGHTIG